MTIQPCATPAIRAEVLINNRLRMTIGERLNLPLTHNEAVTLATGSTDPTWRNCGLQTMRNFALRAADDVSVKQWGKVADIIDGIPPQNRPVGVLRFFLDHTINGADVKWATRSLELALKGTKASIVYVPEQQAA